MSRSRSSSFVRTPGFQPKGPYPMEERRIDPFEIPASPSVSRTPASDPDQEAFLRTPQEILKERRNSPLRGPVNPPTKEL